MKEVVFDIEADGLLDSITRIHCIGLSINSQPTVIYTDWDGYQDSAGTLKEGLDIMSSADKLIGHNIHGYDILAIDKITGWRAPKNILLLDTLIMSNLLFPEIALKSFMLPPGQRGSHGLKAWGLRLKHPKTEFEEFETISVEMLDYCKNDVDLTVKVYQRLLKENYSEAAIKFEMKLAPYLERATARGFPFNREKASELYGQLLQKRHELKNKVSIVFPPIWIPSPVVTPTKSLVYKDFSRASRTEGASYTPIDLQEFNSNSRPQIEMRLKAKYGWDPVHLTPTGRAELDGDILADLPYEEAQLLSILFDTQKLIAMMAEGKHGWTKVSEKDGRIHSRINQCRAVTRRMSCMSPNLQQIPVRGEYGPQCRELFTSSPGKVLVGADLEGIEARCLAHYLYPFDGGYLATIIETGNKKLGTDIHSLNAKACGLDRDQAKTALYAIMYGAGTLKVGLGLEPTFSEFKAKRLGKQIKDSIEANMEGYADLSKAVQKAFNDRGYVKALDGGRLIARNDYSALNTLLQSAGALVAKQWFIASHENLEKAGFIEDKDYAFLLPIHDEGQWDVSPDKAEQVGKIIQQSSLDAGDYFGIKIPTRSEYSIGKTWSETH